MNENKELQIFCEASLTSRRKWNNYKPDEDTVIYNMASIGYVTAWIKCTIRKWKYARKKIYTVCGTYKYGMDYIERRRNYFEFLKTENLDEAKKLFKKYVITMLTDGDDRENIGGKKCALHNQNFTLETAEKLLDAAEDAKTASEKESQNLNLWPKENS